MAHHNRGAGVGVDYSANAPSLSSAHLLATIPVNYARAGYMVMNQDAADTVYAVFDDGLGNSPTVFTLATSGVAGGQGGTLDMRGMPHTGRILLYGTNTTTKMAAREW